MSATKKLTGMGGDLQRLAALLQSKGRKGDTILAHINPREAALLKARGGSGTRNPETGLMQFDNPNDLLGYTMEDLDPGTGKSSQQNVAGPDALQGLGSSGAPTAQDPSGAQNLPNAQDPFAVNNVSTPATQTPTTSSGSSSLSDFLSGALNKFVPGGNATGSLLPIAAAGGMGVLARNQAARAAQQGQQYKQEYQGLASPYKSSAQSLMGAAQRGELTPANQQVIEAARAQLAQGASSRGGVGAEQTEAQIARIEQQLIQNQYNMGLQVAQLGDALASRGIQAGIASDTNVQNMLTSYMQAVARLLGGSGDVLGNANKPAAGGGGGGTGSSGGSGAGSNIALPRIGQTPANSPISVPPIQSPTTPSDNQETSPGPQATEPDPLPDPINELDYTDYQ